MKMIIAHGNKWIHMKMYTEKVNNLPLASAPWCNILFYFLKFFLFKKIYFLTEG